MLSILIPTYNYNTFSLVVELHKQCLKCAIDFEIIVADDASNSDLNSENNKINRLSNCSFFCNEKNLGRAKNRNLLARLSTKKWLLFLDSDMFPKEHNFIQKYIEIITNNQDKVIYGGICYEEQKTEKNQMLRWKFGTNREAKSLENRLQNPTFALTSNLVIAKTVFNEIKFDETINTYGYEDLIFTTELKNRNHKISQINNNAYHLNLESSETFLYKTEISLQTLHSIAKKNKVSTQITKYYSKIKKYKFLFMIQFLFTLFKKPITKNLLSNHPSLFLFDFYKLGYYCSLK